MRIGNMVNCRIIASWNCSLVISYGGRKKANIISNLNSITDDIKWIKIKSLLFYSAMRVRSNVKEHRKRRRDFSLKSVSVASDVWLHWLWSSCMGRDLSQILSGLFFQWVIGLFVSQTRTISYYIHHSTSSSTHRNKSCINELPKLVANA